MALHHHLQLHNLPRLRLQAASFVCSHGFLFLLRTSRQSAGWPTKQLGVKLRLHGLRPAPVLQHTHLLTQACC